MRAIVHFWFKQVEGKRLMVSNNLEKPINFSKLSVHRNHNSSTSHPLFFHLFRSSSSTVVWDQRPSSSSCPPVQSPKGSRAVVFGCQYLTFLHNLWGITPVFFYLFVFEFHGRSSSLHFTVKSRTRLFILLYLWIPDRSTPQSLLLTIHHTFLSWKSSKSTSAWANLPEWIKFYSYGHTSNMAKCAKSYLILCLVTLCQCCIFLFYLTVVLKLLDIHFS